LASLVSASLARAAFLRSNPLCQAAAYLYHARYFAEDLLPLGPFGYHLLVAATRRPSGS